RAWVDRAHDHDVDVVAAGGGDPAPAEEHDLGLLKCADDADDSAVGALGGVSRRSGSLHVSHPGGVDIEASDPVAGLLQAFRHRPTHLAQANEADGFAHAAGFFSATRRLLAT